MLNQVQHDTFSIQHDTFRVQKHDIIDLLQFVGVIPGHTV